MWRMILLLGAAVLAGCSEEPTTAPEMAAAMGDFTLATDGLTLRSYPGGGGVFVVALEPSEDFAGSVRLSLAAATVLHAELNREILEPDSCVAEVVLHPERGASLGMYDLKLVATHGLQADTVTLTVDVIDWSQVEEPGWELDKLNDFLPWLHDTHPEIGDLSGQQWFRYITRPQILVVEHWTFLSRDWELRLSFHVMIPPYDWSRLLVRRRGEVTPRLAALRATDGTITEIPVSEFDPPIVDGQ